MALNVNKDFYSENNNDLLFKEEKDNKVPSKVMWALALLTHEESPYYSLDLSNKQALIKGDYLEDNSFDFSRYDNVIGKMERIYLSKPKRYLRQWEEKLEERNEFIASKSYNENTYEMLDKLLAQTDKLWSQYLKIRKAVESEDSTTLGDIEESLSEKGLI